jgi:hypothetical protein
MSDPDDFLATTLAPQVEAEEALHNGDPAPRLAMWSTQDPVTVWGRCGAPALGRSEPALRLARVGVLRLHLRPLRAPCVTRCPTRPRHSLTRRRRS